MEFKTRGMCGTPLCDFHKKIGFQQNFLCQLHTKLNNKRYTHTLIKHAHKILELRIFKHGNDLVNNYWI